MRHIFLFLLTSAIFILSACSNNSKRQNSCAQGYTDEVQKKNISTVTKLTTPRLSQQYGQLVSSLATDDDKATVYVAQGMVKALYNMDSTTSNVEQKKAYKGISASIKENGIHIVANLKNVAHHREYTCPN